MTKKEETEPQPIPTPSSGQWFTTGEDLLPGSHGMFFFFSVTTKGNPAVYAGK